LICDLCVINL